MEELYSEEAAREILKQAMELQTKEKDFTRSQLEEMAQELGIAPTALAEAEQFWLANRETVEEQKTLAAEKEAFERDRQLGFKVHFTIYLLVNLFLMVLNLTTSPEAIWFFWPLMGWGFGMAGHYWSTVQKEGQLYEQQFAQWRMGRTLGRKLSPRLSS